MEDYRSNYKGKVFGIKRMEGFFAVEEANLFGDLSKYDFIMKDKLTYSYNGNHNYCVEIMKEACEEPIFNGWKIENLYFYGNWYGQAPAFNLIKDNGEEYHSDQFTNERIWYDKQPEVMIRETLLKVLKFTEQNRINDNSNQ